MNKSGYRIAFSFEGEFDHELKDDPRYVKILARLWTQKNAVKSETILSYHKCTSEDLEEFYPLATKSRKLYNSIQNDPKRGFYCLDWTDDFLIYGDETMDS